MSEDKKTIVVFSGDLDKAMAAMIIASGAAAMGNEVTLFFTFWGLNLLRKPEPVSVKKNILEAMFGWMMPRGARRATLSKMHMGGMGTAMMKYVMKTKNVATPEALMQDAMDMGVKFIACSMSMDVMGIKAEELIDGVEIGGVATYLGSADEANVNLFI
jgi:peroxiredoxin family protein